MKKCKECGMEESWRWWKCCPEHTTERGSDVVCHQCAKKCFSVKSMSFTEDELKRIPTNTIEHLETKDQKLWKQGYEKGVIDARSGMWSKQRK